MSDYSEEQQAIRRVVREFARKEVAPGAAERDASGRFDYTLYRRLGELGIPGLMFPADLDGGGADFLTFCLAVEEVARVDLSLSWTLGVAPAGAQQIIRRRFRRHVIADQLFDNLVVAEQPPVFGPHADSL